MSSSKYWSEMPPSPLISGHLELREHGGCDVGSGAKLPGITSQPCRVVAA